MRLSWILVGLSLVVVTPQAHADTEGKTGRIAGLRLINQQSDEFSSFHGGVSVDEGKGVVTEYFWGGNRCPGLDSLDSVVAHVSRALGNDKLRIKPLYKLGAGGTRCLTEALIVVKAYVDVIEVLP